LTRLEVLRWRRAHLLPASRRSRSGLHLCSQRRRRCCGLPFCLLILLLRLLVLSMLLLLLRIRLTLVLESRPLMLGLAAEAGLRLREAGQAGLAGLRLVIRHRQPALISLALDAVAAMQSLCSASAAAVGPSAGRNGSGLSGRRLLPLLSLRRRLRSLSLQRVERQLSRSLSTRCCRRRQARTLELARPAATDLRGHAWRISCVG